MASIYELTNDIQMLWNMMDAGELSDDDLVAAMTDSQEELSVKMEGYCKWIRNMEADVKAFKEEEKRLSDRRKTLENSIDRAKAAMKKAMETAGEKKIPCGVFTVSLSKNPGKVIVDVSVDNVPKEYLRFPKPEVDKTKLGDALKEGVNLKGIAHLEQSESLSIR